MTVQEATQILCKFYDFANAELFHIGAPRPQITIQAKGKNQAYGWFTLAKCWSSGDDCRHEINICAEHLDRDIYDVACTLLHEMVHYYNFVVGVQDCSRGGMWHNKDFKRTAENFGMRVLKEAGIGYGRTILDERGRALVDSAIINGVLPQYSIGLKRAELSKVGGSARKSHIRKYVCLDCGCIVRAARVVNILCMDCDSQMVEETE